LSATFLPTVFLSAIALLLLASILHRTERILWKLRWILVVMGAYLAGVWVAVQLQRPAFEPILWGWIAGIIADRMIPSRSRRIPNRVRNKVIGRWEARTGKKFSSRLYEIDHIIPFSKGGNSSESNLRVVTRRQNRSKGAQSPWWDLFAR